MHPRHVVRRGRGAAGARTGAGARDDSDTDLEEAGKKAEDVLVCRPGSGADTDGSDTDLSAAAPAPAADDSDTDLST